MSEADFLTLQVELLNSAWSVLQVWFGATSAVIAAIHFAAPRFNHFLVTGMTIVYALFSAGCFVQSARLWSRIEAVADDLVRLRASGYELSESASILIQNVGSGVTIAVLIPAMSVIFVASVAYVIYAYRKAHG